MPNHYYTTFSLYIPIPPEARFIFVSPPFPNSGRALTRSYSR